MQIQMYNFSRPRTSTALKAPHIMKTARQIVVNVLFRQSEFGIMAGRPMRSCRPTQSMKHGIRANEILSRTILDGSLMSDVLPVIVLE